MYEINFTTWETGGHNHGDIPGPIEGLKSLDQAKEILDTIGHALKQPGYVNAEVIYMSEKTGFQYVIIYNVDEDGACEIETETLDPNFDHDKSFLEQL